MTARSARKVRNRVSQTLTSKVVQFLVPYIGQTASADIAKKMAGRTGPLVRGARDVLAKSANREYREALGPDGKPFKPVVLNRFDEDVWIQSVEKALLNEADSLEVEITKNHLEDIARKADHWAKDAERGTLIDFAMRDNRFEGWARIDPEPPTCPFCTVLISIGPKRTDPNQAHFHIGDTCEVQLVLKGQEDYPGADQVKAAEEKYKQAVRLNGGKTDLAGLVKQLKTIDPEGQN